MKILIIYPPFSPPLSLPYSIAALKSELINNSHDIATLDLNLEYHKKFYPDFCKFAEDFNYEDYVKVTTDFMKESKRDYSLINKLIYQGKYDDKFFKDTIKRINSLEPDLILISVVYSSQVFFTHALINALNQKIIIGGPSVNDKLKSEADFFPDIKSLQKHLEIPKKINSDIDYSKHKDYPTSIIPIKTSHSCPWKSCTFCTHHDGKYIEYPLEDIEKSIKNSGSKYAFIIDDMIPTSRLLKIAAIMKKYHINWMCQLKPKNLSFENLKTLSESGLKIILWGFESASQRILDLMHKGTDIKEIQQILTDSHNVGIKNVMYTIFGFPTETKEEFLQTITFLEDNKENIDLISTSIFGLQKNTDIYNNPQNYGITNITEEKRTLLDPNITYKTKSGLSQDEAKKLREKYKRTIYKLNKFPKSMNLFREHMLMKVSE